jgi:hypothetical protein
VGFQPCYNLAGWVSGDPWVCGILTYERRLQKYSKHFGIEQDHTFYSGTGTISKCGSANSGVQIQPLPLPDYLEVIYLLWASISSSEMEILDLPDWHVHEN